MVKEIELAAEALKKGQVILYPTDTIWGLGCDPRNDGAVKEIFSIKQRDDSKALILLINEIGRLYDYVLDIPPVAWDIVEYAEKPLTVVYPKGKNVAGAILGEDGSIAIRLTKDEFCKKLINRFGGAIVSTSANISGEPSPSNYSEVAEHVKNKAGYIVNYRREELKMASPSTIIKLELNGEIKFLRK